MLFHSVIKLIALLHLIIDIFMDTNAVLNSA